MLVWIHSDSPVLAAVERNRTFCVNLLGEGQVTTGNIANWEYVAGSD